LPEEVIFVLLGCGYRVYNRARVWTAVLKKSVSNMTSGVKNAIPYSKCEGGHINPEGWLVCWKAIVTGHLGVTKSESMFLRCKAISKYAR